MMTVRQQYLLAGIMASSAFTLVFVIIYIQNEDSWDNSRKICVYGLEGEVVIKKTNCSNQGTPTVLSQVKDKLGKDSDYVKFYDKHEYVSMVFEGNQCLGGCDNENMTKACKYDVYGQFIPHLSDAQKAVLLDLQNNFSIPICPFIGKTNVFPETNMSNGYTTLSG
jgi:hypothetical protein